MTTAKSKFDYQSIYNLSPTAIIILDANGIILEANKTFRDWLNVKTNDVIGKNIFMIKNLPKESKVKILEQFSLRTEGKIIPPYEISFNKKKGEKCLGAVYESPIMNKNGDLDKILVVISDITGLSSGNSPIAEVSQIETRPKGPTEHVLEFERIFENCAIAIFSANDKELITHWNKHTEELLEKTKEDLELKPVSSLYPPEEWEKIKNLKRRIKEKKAHFETIVLKKDGTRLDAMISLALLRDKEGKVTRCIGIIRDITAQKRAESAAHIAQSRYQTIFDNSAIGIMMADANEQIVSWNNFTEILLGKSREDLYLKQVKSLYTKDEWTRLRSMDVRKKGIKQNIETQMITKNGKIIDVNMSLSVLKDDTGKVSGSIAVFQDITDIKIAEQEKTVFSRMKHEFVSMVSHELRTPIASIRGSIEIVTDESAGPINPEQKDFLLTAKEELTRLENLISDVIDYQKLSASNFELSLIKNSINDTVERIHQEFLPMAQEKKLEFNALLLEESIETSYDDAKISQVLTNLVENAIKFTEFGSITITIEKEEQENHIKITVMDTGKGIKQEHMEQLFQTFSQISQGDGRETGDTGLGLAISQLIIEKHGGKIWAESEIDKGTKFFFTIPLKS